MHSHRLRACESSQAPRLCERGRFKGLYNYNDLDNNYKDKYNPFCVHAARVSVAPQRVRATKTLKKAG